MCEDAIQNNSTLNVYGMWYYTENINYDRSKIQVSQFAIQFHQICCENLETCILDVSYS